MYIGNRLYALWVPVLRLFKVSKGVQRKQKKQDMKHKQTMSWAAQAAVIIVMSIRRSIGNLRLTLLAPELLLLRLS